MYGISIISFTTSMGEREGLCLPNKKFGEECSVHVF